MHGLMDHLECVAIMLLRFIYYVVEIKEQHGSDL
jgi:hypothetical protein